MNIIERIVSHNFIASETDVQQLAAQVAAGKTADSTYLKVLVVAVQSAPARKRQPALALFESVNERLYQAVLAGVADATTPNTEVNRRATFARTSASALRKWIKSGGDVKTIDPLTVTKASLAPARPKLPGDRIERSIRSHSDALLATMQKLEASDPLRAASALSDLISTLQAELEALEDEHESQPAARVVRTPALERVLHSRADA